MYKLFTIATGILPYLLSIPQGPAPQGGWPVMVFLHGRGQGPNVGGPLMGGPGWGAPEGMREKFIIIAPNHTTSTSKNNFLKYIIF